MFAGHGVQTKQQASSTSTSTSSSSGSSSSSSSGSSSSSSSRSRSASRFKSGHPRLQFVTLFNFRGTSLDFNLDRVVEFLINFQGRILWLHVGFILILALFSTSRVYFGYLFRFRGSIFRFPGPILDPLDDSGALFLNKSVMFWLLPRLCGLAFILKFLQSIVNLSGQTIGRMK